MHDSTDGNPFPDGTGVRVAYPLFFGQDRAEWPWFDGVVEQRCGPDEWQVTVTDPDADVEVAVGEPYSPQVFRGHSEIRCRSVGGRERREAVRYYDTLAAQLRQEAGR